MTYLHQAQMSVDKYLILHNILLVKVNKLLFLPLNIIASQNSHLFLCHGKID